MKILVVRALSILLIGLLFQFCATKKNTSTSGLGADMEMEFAISPLASKVQKLFENTDSDSVAPDVIQVSLRAVPLSFEIPAIQSATSAFYEGKWVLFGGRKSGLHSMDNSPRPFMNLTANDSIWVIDLVGKTAVGVPIPEDFAQYLTASSTQHFQEGDLLYVSGGYTYSDDSEVSNWTSDYFHEISVPNLISYVTSGGTSPSFDQVINKQIADPFLQVTGGEMMLANGNFYLVGGQNYVGPYTPGTNGIYTSAVRKFRLGQIGSDWVITDTLSVVDEENLHRRDYNLAEVITSDTDSLGAVIFGGVFNKQGLGYRSPVYLNGLGTGKPEITVDDQTLQKVNLYTSAKINAVLAFGEYRVSRITMLGGITYLEYNKDSRQLSVPSADEMPLPFSNMISSYYTNGEDETLELVQLPPNEMMPGFLGANAIFFPEPALLYGDTESIIDLNKVFPGSANGPVLVGYMFGGIDSPAGTTTGMDRIQTSTNKTLYGVYMTLVE